MKHNRRLLDGRGPISEEGTRHYVLRLALEWRCWDHQGKLPGAHSSETVTREYSAEAVKKKDPMPRDNPVAVRPLWTRCVAQELKAKGAAVETTLAECGLDWRSL